MKIEVISDQKIKSWEIVEVKDRRVMNSSKRLFSLRNFTEKLEIFQGIGSLAKIILQHSFMKEFFQLNVHLLLPGLSFFFDSR